MEKKILAEAEDRMKKAIVNVGHELAQIRTGKASSTLLDIVKVNYHGTMLPVNQVATITVPEPRLIVIQPWEKGVLPEVVKAIQKSDLGLNPIDDGITVKLSIPSLTEERRKDLAKLVAKLAEEGRIAIRAARRDANDHLKKLEKEEHLSEDLSKRSQAETQKLTDKYISQIDELLAKKQKEIMEV
ncbi:MAG: ribosome recycling factor [Candidatus Eisenbacteria bacterium]|nr:ribosome recycling factor [Candidatus Eisenbacteria bacterium]